MSYIDIKPYHNLTAPSVPMSDDSATEDLCSQVTASQPLTKAEIRWKPRGSKHFWADCNQNEIIQDAKLNYLSSKCIYVIMWHLLSAFEGQFNHV